MSNFDLLDWCRYLNIPIKSVLSRDQKVPHNHKQTLFIYNLEPSYMKGSHWCATYAKDNVINYFDSFGMPCHFKSCRSCKERECNLITSRISNYRTLYSTVRAATICYIF